MNACIIVNNLGKKYKRYPNRWTRLGEWLSFGRYQGHQASWILRNLSFELNAGESLGVIGVNGAGKSTLLKLLTRTSVPSEGKIEIHGRVSALLELGMGFHQDFSGRVNALMTCQMMGYSSEEAHALLEEIREFSELGDYMDQPVRVYSTGMQVRLAFSAATVRRPEILIVDEALSVGDAYFQHKCISRIREYRDQGTTLLFVSHDPGAVKSLCNRAILLDGGAIVKDGAPDTVLDYYNSVIARNKNDEEIRQVEGIGGRISTRSGNGTARIMQVDITKNDGLSVRSFLVGEQVVLRCAVDFYEDMDNPTVGILLRDRMGNDVYGTNTTYLGHGDMKVNGGDSLDVAFTLPLNIGPGNYSVCVAIHAGESHLEGNCDWWDRCLVLQVIAGDEPPFVGVVSLPVEVMVSKTRRDNVVP
ncbi:MAG: ABC transporter ATP-binding protein [Proteobacteria bacterium]|nr:ABC transporter ATP-binding protein [Desulfocapsa sp.]MBU3946010.1 ABC transporter ATP-binding protein [Pseudomonadota bacterium]MCG2743070.1 ABC transporter ATP-binding protein [Desulfobacteraceae bacterium]MBU4030159.1 ABC transporter ATP-binding protein [Pseudomonadota bacterium]MBU4043783.1 ABC transporter ATP-binding protein [Pseudomonadota bacterium]